jgi:hypothetical protein
MNKSKSPLTAQQEIFCALIIRIINKRPGVVLALKQARKK